MLKPNFQALNSSAFCDLITALLRALDHPNAHAMQIISTFLSLIFSIACRLLDNRGEPQKEDAYPTQAVVIKLLAVYKSFGVVMIILE